MMMPINKPYRHGHPVNNILKAVMENTVIFHQKDAYTEPFKTSITAVVTGIRLVYGGQGY